MEANTKKYLIGAGVLVGGYLVYLRARHNAKSETTDKKAAKKPAAPATPSASGQFTPVGLPQTYNPYPQIPFAPSYIPPGPGYIPPVGYPGQYPSPYPTPYPPSYPGTGYPPPGVNCQAAAQSVIGLSQYVAQSRLSSLGIQSIINGRPSFGYTGTGPSVNLYVVGGIVRSAVCNQSQPYNYPAAY